jgi:D-proline reductase (dithiol) PrdB
MSEPLRDPTLRSMVEHIRAEIDPAFDFVALGPPPWCPPPASARDLSIALVTTAGLHLKGDRPFRALEDPLGDTTFRLIPSSAPAASLDLRAPYVDQRHIPQDPEVALPLRALESLHRQGLTGPPAPHHASFCGGIVRPLPGLEESAERLAILLHEEGAGAAILLPSCPLCVQTVCLLARGLETRGLPTVCVTLVPELSRIVGAPRTLALRFRFGAPCGDPGHAALHQAVLREALAMLDEAVEPATLRSSRLAWRRPPEVSRPSA